MAGKWKDRDEPKARVNPSRSTNPKSPTKNKPCITCKGKNKVDGKPCPACHGTGGINIGTV